MDSMLNFIRGAIVQIVSKAYVDRGEGKEHRKSGGRLESRHERKEEREGGHQLYAPNMEKLFVDSMLNFILVACEL